MSDQALGAEVAQTIPAVHDERLKSGRVGVHLVDRHPGWKAGDDAGDSGRARPGAGSGEGGLNRLSGVMGNEQA
jgi:hypothetical protein